MSSKCRFWMVLAAAVAVITPGPVFADDALVGSVNPTTGQATLFTDLLRTEFPDGGPIFRLYAVAREGDPANGFVLVRAGKLASGECHAEAIALQREGSRLLLPRIIEMLFTCVEGDNGCDTPTDTRLCIVNNAGTGCVCKSTTTGQNGGDCDKSYLFPWVLTQGDVVQVRPTQP